MPLLDSIWSAAIRTFSSAGSVPSPLQGAFCVNFPRSQNFSRSIQRCRPVRHLLRQRCSRLWQRRQIWTTDKSISLGVILIGLRLKRTVDLAVSVRRHKLNGRRWIRVFARRGFLRTRCSSEPSVFLNCQGMVMYLAFDDRRTSQHDAVRIDGALKPAADR